FQKVRRATIPPFPLVSNSKAAAEPGRPKCGSPKEPPGSCQSASITIAWARCVVLILGRLPLHVIDYQNSNGSLLQLKLQSQLLTDGVGKRKCAIRIRRAAGLAGTLEAVLQNADCAKTQREIVGVGQTSFIQYGGVYVSVRLLRKLVRELRHRYVAAIKQSR